MKRSLLVICIALFVCAAVSCSYVSDVVGGIIGGSGDNGQAGNPGIDVIIPDNDSSQTPDIPEEEKPEWPEDVVVGNSATGEVADVLDEKNSLSSSVDLVSDNGLISATLPEGALVAEGTTSLTFSVKELEESGADITLADNESSLSVDVHIEGLSPDNETVIKVYIKALLPVGLNMGNYSLYHVENGETVLMTLLGNEEPVHNSFEYDPVTGDTTMYLKSFSEIALVSDDDNAWEGKFDYSWYEDKSSPYVIANADQLAAFGAIVGGMLGRERDSFAGQYIKLIADINLGDKESENNPNLIFYPIGYYNSEGTYERTNTAITSGLRNFEGTFDGNGSTIFNIYQNTWEMKGDHDWYTPEEQYYRDGMGLFGRVYGGTVKNLTVSNFSSDGEITTTGVIAAYADFGATFENIAIFNCNPRVYNIGNGGIVGCVGWYTKAETDKKVTFNNITVDNSNKISALWGSYDVACGGIVGQYYPTSGQSSANYPVNAGVHFENCHISAVMDVYNDVCANYQYYAYRYTGMLIGSIRENVTIDGHVYPKMDGITASGCTVHFGDWNDYYYCELVANTTASYTHDHQMSRLEQVLSVDVENKTVTYLNGTVAAIPSGRVNYVVVKEKNDKGFWIHGDGSEYATCYHFVDGEVWNHEDAGYHNGENGEKFIDENGNGVGDLKEDKQLIYREFNQLFTGYGWGVTSKGLTDFEGVENMGITEGDYDSSVKKFEVTKSELTNNRVYKLGDIFAYIEGCGVELVPSAIMVGITNLDENGNVTAEIVYDRVNWENTTIKFTGKGNIKITIQDYYFCTPTELTVNITERQPEVKFDVVMNNGDFLHRVGNSGTVALDKLFKAKDGVEVGTVSVTVEAVNGTSASGTYSNNAIQFSGTGVVKVTITDNDYCTPTELYLEVVDATNVTGLSGTITSNVVLLQNCGLSSLTVSGRNTVYGNGFTATYSGNGQYLNNGLKQGVITVSENGTLDNLRIVAPVYPVAYMYYSSAAIGSAVTSDLSTVEGDKTRYHYQLSAVAASGNATISNCYIYGGRNNIFVNTGDVTIKDTILECGTVANIQIQSNSSHVITLENLTTIQYLVDSNVTGTTSKKMMGAGIIVGPETNDNPAIVLNGTLKQYNWVTETDESAVSDEAAKKIINAAVSADDYKHSINNTDYVNLGFIYMNNYSAKITNNTGLPYKLGTITISGVTGQVYSLQGATGEQIYSDYANADKSTVNGWYEPQFKYDSDLGDQYVAEGGDEHCYREGDTIKVLFPSGDTKEINLAALVNIVKYTGQDLKLVITCVDSSGNSVSVIDGKITLSAADEYTVTYTVTDTLFYDKDGNTVTKSVEYSWNVTISVSLKDKSTPNAYFEFDSSKQTMGYAKKSTFAGGNTQYLPFLAGLKIYDYVGQDAYLRFDGDNDFSKIAAAEITGYTSANHVLIKVTLTDGGVINVDTTARAASGAATYTGTLNTSGNILYYVNAGTTSATTTTWVISSYKFTGNNGVEIDSGAVTFSNCVNGSVPTGSFSTTIKYTVSYEANGGNCGQTTGYATSASAAVTLPTPTRSGYIFAGWYTAESGGTRAGGAGDSYTPSSNVTLYAQWGKPCTVTYNANGGSCGTSSEKYDGTALTLPTATRDGHWFIGWYDAAEGGNKIGDAGATYNPNGEITLYAHWQEKIEYTVTYNANGGTCSTTSATYQGTPLTLPTPTRTGYTFNGWYTEKTGGTKVGDPYIPDTNITLYAQWEKISYTITISTNNATVFGVTDGQTAYYGDTISFTVTYSGSRNQTTTVKDANGNTITTGSSFTMPASNVTITASSSTSSTCVTPDTLVTLADGTQKEIQYVTYDDQLLVWNFYTGEYDIAYSSIVMNHGYSNYTIVALRFSDGTEVKTINGHGFFDTTANKYVIIDEANVASYVGHKFIKHNNDAYTTVQLISYEIYEEYTESWSILTAGHYNCILEGMWTVTPAEVDGSNDYLMPFDIDANMKYNEAAMQADIEKYGLYTYDDFAEYMTAEQFEALALSNWKVSVGKGYITWEEILYLISIHLG